jgi:transcriptional regulator with XRE-family HTH domain
MRRKVIRYRLKSARLGKRQVPAIGTHRRIQALNRWGWTRAQIGERMGVTPSAVTRLLEQQVVFADTAARVTKVFDTLVREGRPGTSTKTRERAIRAGWGGPLDWDEGNIEDPQAVPIFLVEAAHAEAIELHKTFVKRQRNRVRSQAIRLAERSKPRVLEVAA